MKIAFDHQTFTYQKYGGISRYYSVLADELYKNNEKIKIFAGFYRNSYIEKLPGVVVQGTKVDRYPKNTAKLFMFFNHIISQAKILEWKPDLIHETYYSSLLVLKTNAVRVTTAYDMIHELFPEIISAKDKTAKWKKTSFNRVDHIISISHSTKKDLIELYGIDEKKISVIHLGVDLETFTNIKTKEKLYERPYLIYVGDRKGYKNFKSFIEAFSNSNILMSEFDIVTFGGGEFNKDEKNLFIKRGFSENQIRQVSGCDTLLSEHYKNAKALVYPSYYEGFGLPLLEAMSSGCPVICSNTSSLPEILNNSGLMFNPNNIDEIQTSIEAVVLSESMQIDLINKGLENVKSFSWDKCAIETLKKYKELVEYK